MEFITKNKLPSTFWVFIEWMRLKWQLKSTETSIFHHFGRTDLYLVKGYPCLDITHNSLVFGKNLGGCPDKLEHIPPITLQPRIHEAIYNTVPRSYTFWSIKQGPSSRTSKIQPFLHNCTIRKDCVIKRIEFHARLIK